MAAVAVIAAAAWAVWQQSLTDLTIEDIGEEIVTKAASIFGLWRAPLAYAEAIAAAEWRWGLPAMLLERLLWQECRYREDIITGRVRSPVGAVGIAQFMPATAAELGVDPLNTGQAIDGAARYLRQLYGTFGNWTEALAAYNWGQGNVARKGLAAAPRETRNYFTSILADVNSAAGTDLA
ncbi:MAG TPA: lytic transglycosylase domain-containing protein [Roseateles sp.]